MLTAASSDPNKTVISGAFSDCALVRRGSNESNHDQTAHSAAYYGCTLVQKGSNELNTNQITLSAACSVEL